MQERSRRSLLAVLLLGAVAVAAFLVLNPSAAVPTRAVLRTSGWLHGHGAPDWLADDDVVEFTFNVLLFVPLTLVGSLLWRRPRVWQWAALGLAASLAVETSQLLFLPDREWAWHDLAANTAGALLGAALGRALRWRRPRPAGPGPAGPGPAGPGPAGVAAG